MPSHCLTYARVLMRKYNGILQKKNNKKTPSNYCLSGLIWTKKEQRPGDISKSVRSKKNNFSRSRLTTSEKHLSGVRILWQMLPMLVILIPSVEFLNSISGSSGNLYSLSSILISLWSFHVSKPGPPDYYLFILYYC